MSLHNMKSLSEVLSELKRQGCKTEFIFEKGKLRAMDSNKSYDAADITIKQDFRFEGETDPADESIIYVLECNDGVKGTISDGYGAYSNEELEQFLQNAKWGIGGIDE